MARRNYKKEYANYHSSLQKINRAGRNGARKMVTKTTGAKKVLGKDVHHRNGTTITDLKFNVTSRTANRSFGERKVKL